MSTNAMRGQAGLHQGDPVSIVDRIAESLQAIRSRTKITPTVGVILGSGLGGLTSVVNDAVAIPYQAIPHMPQLSAAGHFGEWIVGEFAGRSVVMMRGRAHLYEGHALWRATYGVRVMQAMGIKYLVVSNAAGGLAPQLSVGDIVVIDNHINLLFRNKSAYSEPSNDDRTEAGLLNRVPQVYDEALIRLALATAENLGVRLTQGTYLATLGPTYETRAEYRAFRTIGADMVGMSTVPETMLAAALGLHVLAFSVITNVADASTSTETSHAGVLEAAQSAGQRLAWLLQHMLPTMS